MALPPLLAGALQETVACALPAVALTPVGAPGAVGPAEEVTMSCGACAVSSRLAKEIGVLLAEV